MITSDVRTGLAPVPGGHLAYDETGSGSPVVLLHAAIGDRRGWDLLVPELARSHRVIRYDARGFGGSSRPAEPFRLEDDLAALLDHLSLPSAALIGNSFGAATAVDFALAHPDRVDALVLVAPSLTGFPRATVPVDEQIEDAVRRGDLAGAAALDREYWAPLRSDPATEALLDTMVAANAKVYELPEELVIEAPNPTLRLYQVSAPTLVVLGGQDVPEVARIGALLATAVPGAVLATIAEADHLVPLRAPQALFHLIESHAVLERKVR
jgi:pimeloyl-ACP methyl ester carboxylesterase